MWRKIRKFCCLAICSLVLGSFIGTAAAPHIHKVPYLGHHIHQAQKVMFIHMMKNQGLAMFERYKTQEPVDVYNIGNLSRGEIIQAVNDFVNQLQYAHDSETYGTLEHFATPREFWDNKQGDCDDYAIMKYFFLKQLGIPIEDMWIGGGVYTDPATGERIGHALLLVKHNGHMWVLNNGINQIITLEAFTSFELFYAFNEKYEWTSISAL